jgi:hypothetical protein
MRRREKRAIRKQVDQELRETWDKALEELGREGEERLTDAERTQLMGVVFARAILWGLITEIAVALLCGIALLGDDLPNDWWWAFLNGPMVAAGYFLWKREQLLNRATAAWRERRRQLLEEEVARRIHESENENRRSSEPGS